MVDCSNPAENLPQVGIFWVAAGQKGLIRYSTPVSEVKAEAGFKTGDHDHHAVWPDVQRWYPPLASMEYDHVPRGRVVFNLEEERFYVYSNKVVLAAFREMVLREFNLPKQRTRFVEDEHYSLDGVIDIG